MTQSEEPKLYFLSGCRCYAGQGYSPCSCPFVIEIDEHDLPRYEKDIVESQVTVPTEILRSRAVERKSGMIVQYLSSKIIGPCRKGSTMERLLHLHLRMQAILELEIDYRFYIAYLLNDDERYAPVNDLKPILVHMDVAENNRFFIQGVLIADVKERTIHALEPIERSRWESRWVFDDADDEAEKEEEPSKKKRKHE